MHRRGRTGALVIYSTLLARVCSDLSPSWIAIAVTFSKCVAYSTGVKLWLWQFAFAFPMSVTFGTSYMWWTGAFDPYSVSIALLPVSLITVTLFAIQMLLASAHMGPAKALCLGTVTLAIAHLFTSTAIFSKTFSAL